MSTQDRNVCMEIYEKMSFGTKKNDNAPAAEWLGEQKYFDCWIDGKYIKPKDKNDYSESVIDNITCLVADGIYGAKAAVFSSVKAQSEWVKWSLPKRLFTLHKIFKEFQTKQKLFSNLYDLQGQKDDFDLFLDYFNFYSNMLSSESAKLKPVGVVLVILSYKTPAWFSAATSAAALWAGCSVIIKPSRKAPFFPFLIAEICTAAGLPNGLVNVVPGSRKVADFLSTLSVDKIVFSGSYIKGCCIGSKIIPKDFSFFNLGHTAFLIFESCDLNGAVNKLLSEMWKCSRQQTMWRVDLVVVQESIYRFFLEKIDRKIKKIERVEFGEKNRKIDVEKILEEARKVKAEVFVSADNSDSDQILIKEYEIDAPQPELPVTQLLVCRTSKEAVDIVNRASFCMGISLWTENVAHAVEVASKLESSTIWINCHGVINASIPTAVLRKSGTGVLGGLDGGLAYMIKEKDGQKTSKLHEQIIFDKKYCGPVKEMAKKSHDSFMKWKCNRNRKEFLMNVLDAMEKKQIFGEYDNTLRDIVMFWALNGNTYETIMSGATNNLYAAQRKKPVGLIEMVLSGNEDNTETFISWATPAIAMGNVVIIVLDEKLHLRLQPAIQCFLKNLPNGVLEIVRGLSQAHQLAKDSNVKAVWIKENYSVVGNIYSGDEFKRFWSPPSSVPICKLLLEKHCLQSEAVWFPTMNSSN